jgi:RNA polymerase sigma-70 factor (ECF subfamily)
MGRMERATDESASQDALQAEQRDRAELARFVGAGDREALERLLARHAAAAYRVAYHLSRDRDEAEEAVQEGFYHSMLAAASYRGDAPVRSWILALVANAHRRLARTRTRYLRRRQPIGEHAAVPSAEPYGSEAQRQIRACIAELPERYRIPLLLRYIEGQPITEIATQLAMPEKSVRTRIFRGLRRMRTELGRRGVSATTGSSLGAMLPLLTVVPEQHAMAARIMRRLRPRLRTGRPAPPPVRVGGSWVVALAVALLCAPLAFRAARDPAPAAKAGSLPASSPAAAVPSGAPSAVAMPPMRAPSAAAPSPHATITLGPDAQTLSFTPAHGPTLAPLMVPMVSPPGLFKPVADGQPPVPATLVDAHGELQPELAAMATLGFRCRVRPGLILVDRQDPELARKIAAFAGARGERGLAASAQALARSQDVDALRPLLLALAQDGDRPREAAALAALSELVSRASLGRTVVGLFASDPAVRAAIAQARAQGRPLSSAAAMAALARMSNDVAAPRSAR